MSVASSTSRAELIAPSSNLSKCFYNAMQRAGGFEKEPTIAVAVSGGADSMACMLLAHEWAQEHGGDIVALTVDHGLRSEAKDEAACVKKIANEHGIKHHTLTIETPLATTDVQQQARHARYELLEDFCHKHHILHLLTAHHADDNIETFTMRSKRGNNGGGLAGIPFVRHASRMRVIRPLLNMKKEELVQWLTLRHVDWAEDPSNQSTHYERNRTRQELAKQPIDEAQTLQTIQRKATEKSTAYEALCQLAIDSIHVFPEGYLELDTICWEQCEPPQINHLLMQISYSMGKVGPPPRYHEIENLAAQLQEPNAKGCCLAGLQLSRLDATRWRVTRELAHIQPPIPLNTSAACDWDGRFRITYKKIAKGRENVTLRALGEDGAKLLKKEGLLADSAHTNLPRSALLTLPSIWHLDQPLIVPHIGMNAGMIFTLLRWRTPLYGTVHRYPFEQNLI